MKEFERDLGGEYKIEWQRLKSEIMWRSVPFSLEQHTHGLNPCYSVVVDEFDELKKFNEYRIVPKRPRR